VLDELIRDSQNVEEEIMKKENKKNIKKGKRK